MKEFEHNQSGQIRCRDCKWYRCGHNEVDSWSYCRFYDMSVNKTDWCSNAERRKNGESIYKNR